MRMAYREAFDHNSNLFSIPGQFYMHAEEEKRPTVVQEYEVLPSIKTKTIDPVEYEQFKKYLEFRKEKEIIEKYEREGLITIRRRTVQEPAVVKEKESEVSDVAMATMVLGGIVLIIKIAAWVLV